MNKFYGQSVKESYRDDIEESRKQSTVINNRDELYKSIEDYKKKYPNENNVPRQSYWSGWNLNPYEIEFWLNGKDRIHQRLLYSRAGANEWQRYLLNP